MELKKIKYNLEEDGCIATKSQTHKEERCAEEVQAGVRSKDHLKGTTNGHKDQCHAGYCAWFFLVCHRPDDNGSRRHADVHNWGGNARQGAISGSVHGENNDIGHTGLK